MMHSRTCDALIIGSGLVGAALGAALARGGRHVLLAEAGPALPPGPGHHAARERLRRVEQVEPSFVRNMPGAAEVIGPGGQSAVWNGIAVRLAAEERWSLLDADAWERGYLAAEQALRVSSRGESGEPWRRALAVTEPGARPEPLPIAGGDWPIEAAELWGAAPPGRLEVLAGHAVQRLVHQGGRVVEALVGGSGEELRISAPLFVVAAGALRTPQLLWASDLRRDLPALGAYLHDHPLTHALVRVEGPVEPGMLRASPGRPFHRLWIPGPWPSTAALYWYAPGRPRAENKVVFGPELDALGLPRARVSHAWSDVEREEARAALEDLRAVSAALGQPVPGEPPRILPAGSSQHLLGTTRMGGGEADSVTDAFGAVWGYPNLFLAGTGLFPVPTATNPTLTAVALALRTAEHLSSGPR